MHLPAFLPTTALSMDRVNRPTTPVLLALVAVQALRGRHGADVRG